MAELKVDIGADIKNLQKGLDQAEKEVKTFGKDVDKSLGRVGSKGSKAGKGFQQVGKSAANAVPAVTEFSRVIQDAPFGIQGIANNLQQLTANFGNLSKSAGGAIPALKLMFKSLAGPAGILLAVSVVTSALVFFRNNLNKSAKAAKEAAKEQDALSKSLDDYEKSLTSVNRAQLDGAKNATKELTTLRLLNDQVQDTTLSNERRVDAIEDLRKKYPEYLKGLSDEKILAGGLAGVYDTLSTAILNKARAQAAASLIAENTKKELILQSQLEQKAIENAKQSIAIQKDAGKERNVLINQSTKLFSEQDIAQGKLTKGLQDQAKIQDEIIKLQEDSARLANVVSEQGGIAGGDEKAFKKRNDDRLKLLDFYNKRALESLQRKNEGLNALERQSAQENEIIIKSRAQRELEARNRINEQIVEAEKAKYDRLQLQLREFGEIAANIIQGGLTDAFSGIGSAIGGALTEGSNVLSSVGNALLGSLGSLLVEMGKMSIAVGVGLLGIKAALSSLNPAAAIGAGVALVALGSAFSNASRGLSDSIGSSGGGSFSSGVGNTGGGRRTDTGFSSGGGGGGTVVFEIAGTKLVGVLSNTLSRNKNLGGNFTLAT